MMIKPVAVLLADVHYDLNTLEVADAATRQAVAKANELKVPLVMAGDLHNSKANLRGECIKAMRKTFKLCNSPPYFLVGNHCKWNEKSEENSLDFLSEIGPIIDKPVYQHRLGYLIPYQHDPDALRTYLKTLPKKSQLIMHQGIQGSNSGEYIQDKSAITKDDVAGFRVISGHYHNRQTIKLSDNGTWDYIGNPFTLNFAEANDLEKGYQILMNDATLTFVPTNLRRHMIFNLEKLTNGYWQITGKYPIEDATSDDLVLAKVTGTKEELADVTKDKISKVLQLTNFRLELIAKESTMAASTNTNLSKTELLDSIIDSTNNSNECKVRLKQSWRDLCE